MKPIRAQQQSYWGSHWSSAAGLWLVTLLGVSRPRIRSMWKITKQYVNKSIQPAWKWLKYSSEKFLRIPSAYAAAWCKIRNRFRFYRLLLVLPNACLILSSTTNNIYFVMLLFFFRTPSAITYGTCCLIFSFLEAMIMVSNSLSVYC